MVYVHGSWEVCVCLCVCGGEYVHDISRQQLVTGVSLAQQAHCAQPKPLNYQLTAPKQVGRSMQLTIAVKVCEVSIVGCFRCQQLLSVEYMVHGDFQWPSHCCGNNWLLYALFRHVTSLSTIKLSGSCCKRESAAIPELVLNLNQFL